MEKTHNTVRTTQKENKYFEKVRKALQKQRGEKTSLAEMFRAGGRSLGHQLGVDE